MFVAPRLLLVAAAVLAIAASDATASVLRPQRDGLIRASPLGQPPYGQGIAGVGDVNGDGLGDVAVLHEPRDPEEDVSVLVLFGRRDRATIQAVAPGGAGFIVSDPPDQVPSDRRGLVDASAGGASVTGAGDVNGDGLSDVLIGVASVGNSLRRGSGSAFVVFGKRDPMPVRLSELGAGGFRMDGAQPDAALGGSVAALGDLDRDGLADVGLGGHGAAYVVFGSRTPAAVDLRAPGDRAYAVSSPVRDRFESNLHTVAAAGDANGDGRGDLAVAISGFLDGRTVRDERVWVTFGKTDRTAVDLRRLGAGGYEITGTGIDGPDPQTIGPAGDFDGDRRGDLALSNERRAWVVPGRAGSGPVDVRRAPDVLRVRVSGARSASDTPVAGVGDVNGDGRDDVAFGEPDAKGSCRTGAGIVSVVHGRRGGQVDLRRPGFGGLRLLGDATGGRLGATVAGVGDVTGDGRRDLALDIARGGVQPSPDGPPAHELVVVSAAETAERSQPRRGRCLAIRALTRSLRQVRAERRVRVRVSSQETQQVSVSLEVAFCGKGDCYLDPAPGDPEGRAFLKAGGRADVTLRVGHALLRQLRRSNTGALVICANESACVELPNLRRR